MNFPERSELKKLHREDDGFDREVNVNVIEKQKTYIWIRLHLKSELNIENGTIVTMQYKPTSEILNLVFGAYNKKNLVKDADDQVIEYTAEDDKKCLCLLVDLDEINSNKNIPFIRTLFKESKYFDTNNLLIREDEMSFHVNNQVLDYYLINF